VLCCFALFKIINSVLFSDLARGTDQPANTTGLLQERNLSVSTRNVVIVGAGHAGGELATALREYGWDGGVILVGQETYLPYQRPPLSKTFLSGETPIEALFLKPQATYAKAQIDFTPHTRVECIDRSRKVVRLADGRDIAYTKLALTTGGRVRRLAVQGTEQAEGLQNFHYLRTIDDVARIRTQFEHGMRVVIVGAGYIGLEVAAVATKRGLRVTVVEALPRVLARVTAPEISAFYERVHREAGVDLRTNTQVSGFEFDASGDAVSAVLCADGSRVPADLIIVGIGIVPNAEIAQEAGLSVDNGIVVDEFARTSDPDIVAAGDCTNHPNSIVGHRVRLESVPNAVEQGRTAAATLCGKQRPYNAVPWFWSDQYDLKLKMVGLSQGYDQLVLRGSPELRSFSAFYLKGDRMLAADTISRPQEFMISKRLVGERVPVDAARLADDSIPFKSLLPPS
jgi:3-phenylpropionate/trans-cinnamate dioxygenase ferredoxin reductase subunit